MTRFESLSIAIMLGLILGTSIANSANLAAYNKHVCAVYGKMPDCKTDLPESERLQ